STDGLTWSSYSLVIPSAFNRSGVLPATSVYASHDRYGNLVACFANYLSTVDPRTSQLVAPIPMNSCLLRTILFLPSICSKCARTPMGATNIPQDWSLSELDRVLGVSSDACCLVLLIELFTAS